MKPLLREIWKSDRRAFLTILGWNILVSLLGGIGIVMLIPLLNQLEIGSGGYLPGFLLALPYGWRVAALLAAYVALVTVKALLSRGLSIRESEFIENTSLRLRDELYAAVSGASWESLTARKDTDTISLFTSQCGQVSAGISEVIHLLASLVSAGIQLGIALWMSAPVTLLVCLLGACMLAVFKPLRKKSRDYGDEMIRISREFYAELQNQLSSVKEVRAYGVEREHAETFGRINRSFVDARMRYVRLSATPGVVYSVAAALLIAAVYLVCTLGMRVETDRLVVLVYVFARLWPLFSGFQGRMQFINSCVPAYERLNEALSEMRPETGEAAEVGPDFSHWREAAFAGVRFAYRDSDDATLRNMNLTLRRGETLALLGRNGAGKTTAVNLLLGFLLPQSGKITVDSEALTEGNLRAWRKQAGYVPQDPLILNTSVRENLTRFHPGASDETLIAALKAAMAWEFVSKLPEGLDTALGDRGIRLSGGERQRIVLARVLLGRPSLIILDEATSALDYESETAFRQVIRQMSGSAAVVLIAHRLATVRMADRAAVLENGRIVEEGTICDLLAKPNGYLAGMVGVE